MIKKIAIVGMAATVLMGLSFSAMAADQDAKTDQQAKWEKDHPRRDQVNDRLANQKKRIHNEVKEGEMTKAQAASLHKQDAKIRQEERDMASQNGGHITKSEQKVLNQQENAVSKEIAK